MTIYSQTRARAPSSRRVQAHRRHGSTGYRPIWTRRFAHPLIGDGLIPASVAPVRRSPLSGACRRRSTVASHNLRRLWKTAFQTQPPPGVNAPWRPDRDPGSEALIGRNELSRRAHPELSMTLMVDLRIRPARAIQYWRDLPGTPGRQSATVTSRQRRHRSSFDGKDGRPRTN